MYRVQNTYNIIHKHHRTLSLSKHTHTHTNTCTHTCTHTHTRTHARMHARTRTRTHTHTHTRTHIHTHTHTHMHVQTVSPAGSFLVSPLLLKLRLIESKKIHNNAHLVRDESCTQISRECVNLFFLRPPEKQYLV